MKRSAEPFVVRSCGLQSPHALELPPNGIALLGRRPLHFAVDFVHPNVVRVLVDAGAATASGYRSTPTMARTLHISQ